MLILNLTDIDKITKQCGIAKLESQLTEKLANIDGEDDMMRILRQFHHQLVRIAWLNFSIRRYSFVLKHWGVSWKNINLCCERYTLSGNICQQWGTLRDHEGKPQPLLILGMEKLGGFELNFSSDIDLILPILKWIYSKVDAEIR